MRIRRQWYQNHTTEICGRRYGILWNENVDERKNMRKRLTCMEFSFMHCRSIAVLRDAPSRTHALRRFYSIHKYVIRLLIVNLKIYRSCHLKMKQIKGDPISLRRFFCVCISSLMINLLCKSFFTFRNLQLARSCRSMACFPIHFISMRRKIQ